MKLDSELAICLADGEHLLIGHGERHRRVLHQRDDLVGDRLGRMRLITCGRMMRIKVVKAAVARAPPPPRTDPAGMESMPPR